MARKPLRPWLSPKFTYALPARLWRQILEVHDGDEKLASTVLATAFLVAAEQVSVPHRPKPPPAPPPPPICPHCGQRHPTATPAADATVTPQEPPREAADAYQVTETPPHEMPVHDAWRGSWD